MIFKNINSIQTLFLFMIFKSIKMIVLKYSNTLKNPEVYRINNIKYSIIKILSVCKEYSSFNTEKSEREQEYIMLRGERKPLKKNNTMTKLP